MFFKFKYLEIMPKVKANGFSVQAFGISGNIPILAIPNPFEI